MAQKASHLQDMVAYQVIKVIDDGQAGYEHHGITGVVSNRSTLIKIRERRCCNDVEQP
jgi:hypothetical protein